MKTSSSTVRRPLLIFAAVVLIFSLACEGCLSCGDSDREVRQMAEQFPEDTEAMIVLSDLETIFADIEELAESDETPSELQDKIRNQLDELGEELEEDLGLVLDDPESWEERGLNRSGPLVAGAVGEEYAVCLSVSDQEKFDEFMEEALGPEIAWGDEELEREDDREIDGHTVGVFSYDRERWDIEAGDFVDATREIAWGHVDDSACFLDDDADNEPAEAIAGILEGPEGDSLDDNPHFESFRDEVLADSFFAMYIGPDWEDDDELNALLGGAAADPEALSDTVPAFGIGLYHEDNTLRFRSWTAIGDEDLERIEDAAQAEHSVDWENFVTENTRAGLRTSLHPEKTWDQVESTLDDEMLEGIEEVFDQIRQSTDGAFDPEADFIENWTGQLGVFVYGTGDPEQMARRGPDPHEEFEFLAVMQFADEDALDELLEELESVVKEAFFMTMERRAIEDADDIDVLELELDAGVRLYRADDLLVVASDAIGEAGVASYIRGERSEEPLADADSVLGTPFGEEDHFTGLYLTGEGAGTLLELMALPLFDLEIEDDMEVLLSTEVVDTGAVMDIELYPGAMFVGYFLEAL